MSEIDSQLSDMLDDAFAADEPEPSSATPPSDAQIAASQVVDSTSSSARTDRGSTGFDGSGTARPRWPARWKVTLPTEPARQKRKLCCEPAATPRPRRLSKRRCDSWPMHNAPTARGIRELPGPASNARSLGENRGGAGARAESAITGLALLTLMGAGQTHQVGDYADNVYRGLAYLIRSQKPNGSLAGNASVYAANYSHGMAALSMCEAAAISRDPSAILSAQRAIAHTRRMQHPTTGGWRYSEGSPATSVNSVGKRWCWMPVIAPKSRSTSAPSQACSDSCAAYEWVRTEVWPAIDRARHPVAP